MPTLPISIEDSCTARSVIALRGFALELRSGCVGTLGSAIDLPAITGSADECLQTTTGTQIESSTGMHWLVLPMSSECYPFSDERLLGLCEGTVVSV